MPADFSTNILKMKNHGLKNQEKQFKVIELKCNKVAKEDQAKRRSSI